jgi:carboxypeptidase Taq
MKRTAEQAYAELIRREKERAVLNSCAGLLGWDERTHMPPAGANLRGDQLALLARMSHEWLTAPATGELLHEAESGEVDGDAAVNVREIRRVYDRAVKVPKRLVEEIARATTHGQQAWQEAKQKSDFAFFRPHLEKLVSLKREESQAVGYQDVAYDALLDEYEPGATTREVTKTFAELRSELVPLIQAIIGSERQPRTEILQRDYPVDRQRLFGETAAAAIGFAFEAGTLDVTAHPFCSGIGPGDVRITTRYNPNRFSESFFGVLHEAGHGLYEQNLAAAQFGAPLGSACSLGIHESQSRLWENFVGRSRPFWDHFFPRAKQVFALTLRDVAIDDFYFAINDVRPSLIRIEADEATYNLHIILRFELEQALVAGDLPPGDVPGAWNEKCKAFLDRTPPDDAHGCLQDIHWSAALFGYFPTYTLGNLYAAQFMERARQDLPGLDEQFRRGDFAGLKNWLTAKIHRQGQRYRAPELCRQVTGKTLSHEALIRHLCGKFGPLYAL